MVPEGRSDPCKALEKAGGCEPGQESEGSALDRIKRSIATRRRHPGGTDATAQELLASQRCLSHGAAGMGGWGAVPFATSFNKCLQS